MELSDIIIFSFISASIWAIIFAVKKGTVWKYTAGAIFTTYLFCVASVPFQFNNEESIFRKRMENHRLHCADSIPRWNIKR